MYLIFWTVWCVQEYNFSRLSSYTQKRCIKISCGTNQIKCHYGDIIFVPVNLRCRKVNRKCCTWCNTLGTSSITKIVQFIKKPTDCTFIFLSLLLLSLLSVATGIFLLLLPQVCLLVFVDCTFEVDLFATIMFVACCCN